MNVIRSLLGAVALFAIVTPAAAEKLSLDAISAYLNKLVTAQAEFTQINTDGTISTGELFIRRPGRIRFEYSPPDKSLVIASQGQVAIFDSKSNQAPDKFPLVKTPLGLVLANKVDLGRANMVVGHTSDGTTTSVTAQDPDNPEYGTIQMVFTGNPVELRQWIITDGVGDSTVLVLGAMKTGMNFSARVFDIDSEIEDRRY